MSGDTGFTDKEPVMGHSDLERQLHEERNLARREAERAVVMLRELRESEDEVLQTSKPKALARWAAAMEVASEFLHHWETKALPRWSLEKPLKTSKGVELTQEKIDQLAAKFEAGIDPEKLRPRPKQTR